MHRLTPWSPSPPQRSTLSPLLALVTLLSIHTAHAQVPAQLFYQGRLLVDGKAFEGTGQFKLALVNDSGSQTHWLNAPDANGDGQPDQSVSIPVQRGLYGVALGDTSLANMAALPTDVFSNSSILLRVWFDDGNKGFQQLLPDQRILSVGYAMMAANLADGVVTSAKLAPDLSTQLDALNAQIQSLQTQVADLQESAGSGLTVVSKDAQDAALASRGFESFMTVAPPSWVPGSNANAPLARSGHSMVWTGSEALIWGGELVSGGASATGAAYDPALDQWRALSTLDAPSARRDHSAIWTGQEMIVWGGDAGGTYLSDGKRFDSTTQNWIPISAIGSPAGRRSHVAAWTGSKMIIWGGANNTGLLSGGAIYDPSQDSWTALTLANPPAARQGAAFVWAGQRLIIWGGEGVTGALNNGAELLFDSNGSPQEWRPITSDNAPSSRAGHSAIWTGRKMLVWGGHSGGAFLAGGAAYDPTTGAWTLLPAANAPTGRSGHNAVWTGQEMVILNGDTAAGVTASGGAYDPVSDSWRPLSNPGTPVARTGATAMWSGTETLIFGGITANGLPAAALEKVNPQPAWFFYRKL